MNYEIIKGKRDSSNIYFIPEVNRIYVARKISPIIYLRCYFHPACKATGLIKSNKFIDNGPEHTDAESVTSKLAYFKFWNELKEECSTSLRPKKEIFDEFYLRCKPDMPDIAISYAEVESSMKKWKFKSKSSANSLSVLHNVDAITESSSLKAVTSPVMSVDGKMCRVCLSPQRTSKFNLVFGNNGKIAKQIFELTGIKVLEFTKCPALICPKCTGALQRACDLQKEIVQTHRHFNEIYKLCRFEYDIDFGTDDESEDWHVEAEDGYEVKIAKPSTSEMTVVGSGEEVFVITEDFKKEPEDIDEEVPKESDEYTYLDPQTGLVIKSEVKEEDPVEFQSSNDEFQFYDLPDEVLLVLDDDNVDYPKDIDDTRHKKVAAKPTPQPTESKKRSRKENLQSLSCPLCGYKACSDLDSQEHLATVHNAKKIKRNPDYEEEEDNSPEPEVIERNWACSYCGMNFKTKSEFVQHKKDEHLEEEQSLTCRYCDKQFPESIHLRIHIKYTHLDTKLVCPKCEVKFETKEEFKSHLVMENNLREYICEVCSESFMLKHQLNHHIKGHVFSCKQCGAKFNTPATLKMHIDKVHLKIKQHKCGACLQGFAHKYHLKEHLSRGKCRGIDVRK